MYTVESFRKGQRVQLSPATDQWMMGAKFGTVTRVTKTHVSVHVDKLGRVLKCEPGHICEIL